MKNLFAKFKRRRTSNSLTRRVVMACPLAFAEVGVKGRVKSVLNYKKSTIILATLAMVLCVVIAFCFLTTPETIADSKYEVFAKSKNGNVLMDEYLHNYHGSLVNGDGAASKKNAEEACLGELAFYLEAVEKGYKASEKEVRAYIEELKKHYNAADPGHREALKQVISLYGEEAYWEREAYVREKDLTVKKYYEVLEAEWEVKYLEETFLSFDEYYRQYKRELAAKEKFKINYPDLIYETVYLRKIDLQADNNTRKFYKISPEYLYYFENNEWVYIDYMFSFDLSKENLDDLWQKDVSTGEGTEITCEDLRNQNEFAWFASDGVDAFLLLEQKDNSYYIAECITNESHQVIGYKYISRLIVCSPDYAENLENYGELKDNIDRYIDPLTERHSIEEINLAMDALVKYFNRNYHGDVLYEITYNHDANESMGENEMYLRSTYELRPGIFSVNDDEEIVDHDWQWYLYKENGKWHVSAHKSGRG